MNTITLLTYKFLIVGNMVSPLGPTITTVQPSPWGIYEANLGLQDYPTVLFPNLNLANQTTGTCATAGQNITQFIAKNPGMPIPPSLTLAMGPACSGL